MNRSVSIDAKRMRVSSVSSTDGIDAQTIFTFRQSGGTVWASYAGGNIVQGFLIGTLDDRVLAFDYIQVTRNGRRDKGESRCELSVSPNGRLQVTERFQWSSRDGSGVNVLEEIPDQETSMHVSQEAPEQIDLRLRRVIASARLTRYESEYVFVEFPLHAAPFPIPEGALALVRDDAVWSVLTPAQNASRERFGLFRFHFPPGLDNSGFVGWLATHLKREIGTGVFVVCGHNSADGGIFDYWGCPSTVTDRVAKELERLVHTQTGPRG